MRGFSNWTAFGRTTLRVYFVGHVVILAASWTVSAAERDGAARFRDEIKPIMSNYCVGCHNPETSEGGVSFDRPESDQDLLHDRQLWFRAFKQLRSGLMPPEGEEQPTAAEREAIQLWIKSAAFGINPAQPDPGRVTVRRLNRIEYRNTIRDLIGIDFDTTLAFPPDDTGHGFDNIGDVLTMSPVMLEKYIDAAKSIVDQAVPQVPGVPSERTIPGSAFATAEAKEKDDRGTGPLTLSYYEPAVRSKTITVEHEGQYKIVIDLRADERFVDGQFDYNKCQLLVRVDGEEVLSKEFTRQGGRPFHFEIDRTWKSGEHELSLEVKPLTKDKRIRELSLRIDTVMLRGPMAKEHWSRPKNYERFFPREVPTGVDERRAYAAELLGQFARRAFRSPVETDTSERLARLAESIYRQENKTFEAGVAQGIVAILASPRFLFREEVPTPAANSPEQYPLIDEYALASRLSYFLWSSMPDDELFHLAAAGQLRANLAKQVERMLADPRSEQLVRNFVGQWLQSRDIESVPINASAVLSRENRPDPEAEKRRERFRELRRKEAEQLTDAEKAELEKLRTTFFSSFRRGRDFELTGDLRRAMRRETEMMFAFILRQNRSLLEILDADYTFLNERLAKHYGIDGVQGDEMRQVALPMDSLRGGVLTQGTTLVVTSNPDRTSPVKRGLFILNNILGMPPAPPPPDIPALEEAERSGENLTLREALAIHREKAICSSCHNRMDPLGLAFENFNALGRWRDTERGHPLDPKGTLITGESFADIRQLKKVLVTARRQDFYYCLAEKLLTYALGRGLEYYDMDAVDRIVERLVASEGHASVLIAGVIDSVPFQRTRLADADKATVSNASK